MISHARKQSCSLSFCLPVSLPGVMLDFVTRLPYNILDVCIGIMQRCDLYGIDCSRNIMHMTGTPLIKFVMST